MHTNLKSVILGVGIAAALALAPAPAHAVTTWQASTEFDTTAQKVNGVWRYGSANASLFNEFSVANQKFNFVNPGGDKWWTYGDHPSGDANTGNTTLPGVGKNTGADYAIGSPNNWTWGAGTLFLHPGNPDAEPVLIRWVAPDDGNYQFTGFFTHVSEIGTTRTSAVRGKKPVAPGIEVDGDLNVGAGEATTALVEVDQTFSTGARNFDYAANLYKGQTMNFYVKSGGDFKGDHVSFDVTVNYNGVLQTDVTPEPASALLLLAGIPAAAGFIRRKRK